MNTILLKGLLPMRAMENRRTISLSFSLLPSPSQSRNVKAHR